MPWMQELFSAPALERFKEERRGRDLAAVPYFAGLMSGDTNALVRSFSGEPELHHPTRGRIRGVREFEVFVSDMNEWLAERGASVEDVDLVITKSRSIEEVVLHLRSGEGNVSLPVAIVSDRDASGKILEIRVYFSTWPLTGSHAVRPPLLQPDPESYEGDVVGEYQKALAKGDVERVVATFEEDGYAREPAGSEHLHRGTEELRAFYELLFSNDGGIPLEHCTSTDDGRACALEYNVVWWGKTELPPEAGVAVYVRGDSGKLAAARIYDDSDPPLG